MPSYKLTYFNGRGRAECSRLLFAAAGKAYEDCRVVREEWLKLKPTSKLGQLPELEVDGQKYGQSRAIMYYLAREFGFYPSSNLEQLAVDEVVFVLEDFFNAIVKAMFAKEEEKEAKMKEFKETQLDKHLAMLEKALEGNKAKGFFVGDKLSVADIATYDCVSGMKVRFPGCLDSYPLLNGLVDKVGANEGIKAWVAKRPETQM